MCGVHSMYSLCNLDVQCTNILTDYIANEYGCHEYSIHREGCGISKGGDTMRVICAV